MPSPTPAWVDEHASAIQAAAAVATVILTLALVILTLALVLATVVYVYWTKRLADQAKESADAARDLIGDQQRARQDEHAAAVEAVYQELASIAEPLGLVLIHGNLDLQVPFALVAAYRQVLGPLYRGLPPLIGQRLAKTYALLDIQRSAFSRLTINVHQLKIVYNEDLVPTLNVLHAHLHDVGRNLPAPPEKIVDADISLSQVMIQDARKRRDSQADG